MQIVIDIKEEDYRFIHEYKFVPEVCILSLGRAIYDGIPLPKGHGRLIDADYKVSSDGRTIDNVCGYMAPTIIEAESEET